MQSVLNKLNCPMNIIHARSHSRLFSHKYVVIFRGVRYVSNLANIELTEINNLFKCLGGIDQSKVRTLRGVLQQRTKAKKGVQKSMELSVCAF